MSLQENVAPPRFLEAEEPDATVASEDRVPGPGVLRGAGARSPLFWKFMLVAMAVAWGFSFTLMKDVVETVPTFLLLGIRFGGSALLMLAAFHRRIRAHLNRRYVAVGLLMGFFMGMGYVWQTLGLTDTTAGKNAFLTGTYCVLVPFISYAVNREPLTRYNLGAALLCLTGIALVALDNLTVQTGDLLTLVGALFFALQIVTVSKFGANLDVMALTFWMFLSIGAGCLAAFPFVEAAPPASAWTPQLVATIAFLVLVCTFLGLMVQNLGLAHVPSSTGSLLLSLESPSGVFFSVVLAGEMLSGRLIAGFVLIFLAIVLSETHLAFLRRR